MPQFLRWKKHSGTGTTSKAAGWKKKAKSAKRRQPFASTLSSSGSSTTSRLSSRAWKRRQRLSYWMTGGGSRGTFTKTSTTSKVRVRLWKNVVSAKPPTWSGGGNSGPNVDTSMPGMTSVPLEGNSRTRPRWNKPRKARFAKFTGNDHCPGVYQTVALGNERQNWPKKALCSTPNVGSTTCSTVAFCSLSNRLTSRKHSCVGAFGAYSKSPSSSIFATIMRTGTCTYKMPWL
mmetsp:Transcript_24790/g.76564  ORF Transcript_24790/g.76564 Transcript_24790/m.76564 type:complete len:232 (-) Transcript_24790:353-1048(-)